MHIEYELAGAVGGVSVTGTGQGDLGDGRVELRLQQDREVLGWDPVLAVLCCGLVTVLGARAEDHSLVARSWAHVLDESGRELALARATTVAQYGDTLRLVTQFAAGAPLEPQETMCCSGSCS